MENDNESLLDETFIRNLAEKMVPSGPTGPVMTTAEKLFVLLVQVSETYVQELIYDRIRGYATDKGLDWDEVRVHEHYEIAAEFMHRSVLNAAVAGLHENLMENVK